MQNVHYDERESYADTEDTRNKNTEQTLNFLTVPISSVLASFRLVPCLLKVIPEKLIIALLRTKCIHANCRKDRRLSIIQKMDRMSTFPNQNSLSLTRVV